MHVLVTMLIGFGLTMFLHVTVWRTFRPGSPARALVACTIVALLITLGLGRFLFPRMGFPETLEAIIASGALAASYLISLPGLETESPSCLVVTFVNARGPRGATESDLAEVINDETFVLNRLRTLETDGLISRTTNGLHLTQSGLRFLQLFTTYHVLAGRDIDGG